MVKTNLFKRAIAILLVALMASPAFGLATFVGALSVDDFNPLPTSAAGLKNGDYWFDISLLSKFEGEDVSEEFEEIALYLSADAKTIRAVFDEDVFHEDPMDYRYDAQYDEAICMFMCLRQVGNNTYGGFNLLPTSEAGLKKGEYWYDSAAFLGFIGEEDPECIFMAFLSIDGKTLRLYEDGEFTDFETNATDYYSISIMLYLRQAGVDLFAGYYQVALSNQDAKDGYVFLVDKFIDDMIESDNEQRASEGLPPYTAEEEAKERKETLDEMKAATILYNPKESSIGIKIENYYIVYSKKALEESYLYFVSYITKALRITKKPDKAMTYKDTSTLEASEKVTWSSSNEKVVKVDKDTGKITAVGNGSATITATSVANGLQDTCEITVKYSFVQWLIVIFLFGWLWF